MLWGCLVAALTYWIGLAIFDILLRVTHAVAQLLRKAATQGCCNELLNNDKVLEKDQGSNSGTSEEHTSYSLQCVSLSGPIHSTFVSHVCLFLHMYTYHGCVPSGYASTQTANGNKGRFVWSVSMLSEAGSNIECSSTRAAPVHCEADRLRGVELVHK